MVPLFCHAANAGTLHGTVKNGTSGKPAAGVEVILIQLQGGMQPVANTKTDAQGQFTFDNPGIGAQPMLVRAVYNGINFHQPVPPGQDDVEVRCVRAFQGSQDDHRAFARSFFSAQWRELDRGRGIFDPEQFRSRRRHISARTAILSLLCRRQRQAAASGRGRPGGNAGSAGADRKERESLRHRLRFPSRRQNTVRFSYEMPYPNNAATVKCRRVSGRQTARLWLLRRCRSAARNCSWRPRAGHERLRPRKCCARNGTGRQCFRNGAAASRCQQRGGNSEQKPRDAQASEPQAGDKHSAGSWAAGCAEMAADRWFRDGLCAGLAFLSRASLWR